MVAVEFEAYLDKYFDAVVGVVVVGESRTSSYLEVRYLEVVVGLVGVVDEASSSTSSYLDDDRYLDDDDDVGFVVVVVVVDCGFLLEPVGVRYLAEEAAER